MANNVTIPASGNGDATPKVATEQVAGTLEHKQIVELGVPGTGVTLVPATVANGLAVDVTRLPAVTANAGTNLNTSALALDAHLTDRTQKTQITDGTRDGTVKAASTLPLVTDTALVVTARDAVPVTDNAGSLTVDAPVATPVFARLSDGAAALVGQKTMANSLPTVIASDQASIPVAATAPTLTKGTQGATGYSVQDLKDAGRVAIAWTAEVAGAATTEGLLTVTESRDGAAVTTFTSKVVTNGKRLRVHSLQIAVETLGSGTAPQRCYLRLRFNTAGAVTTASPIQGTWLCANNAAVVKSAAMYDMCLPEGFEFLGDGTKQIGFTIQFPDWVVTTATVQAKITIAAFEY